MSLKDLTVISPGTRKLLAITISVALAAVIFAFFYYRGVNRSEDPRVAKAREYMAEYDRLSGGTESYALFHLLDSANLIYRRVPGYGSSYETGVIYNNKGSSLLMKALYDSSLTESGKVAFLELSVTYCDSAVMVYRNWLDEWEAFSEEEVAVKLTEGMSENDPAFAGLNFKSVFRKRVKDMMLARVETPRRLSVSYTNKGTAYRHLMMPDSALVFYERALSIWKHNRTAESNLSVLLGGEPVKPGIIESLFPPDRKKK
ncbi:MAG: tetratricopeptide repeat protein [Bacteroidales bacterium]|nr:tetratricopeptide repeat protein [Bacteroidales bacterium]MDT8373297.1 tetratricopeptide repeat protein [Bacteroidales bacterium]